MKTPDLSDHLYRKLVDRGRLIEDGFAALREISIPSDAPAIQIEEMRNAFFAGAQHLFASIIHFLEPGEDPTPKDLERLTLIAIELQEFAARFNRQHGVAKPCEKSN